MWCLRSRALNVRHKWSRIDKSTFPTISADLQIASNELFEELWSHSIRRIPKLTYSRWITTKRHSGFQNCYNGMIKVDALFKNDLHTSFTNMSRTTHSDRSHINQRLLEKDYEEDEDPFSINQKDNSPSSTINRKFHNRTVLDELEIESSRRRRNVKNLTDHDITEVFPEPASTLNNFQAVLGRPIYNITYKHSPLKPKHKGGYKQASAFWTCRLNFFYSEKLSFETTSAVKSDGRDILCLKVLKWLYEKEFMTIKGMPIHSDEEISNMHIGLNEPLEIELSSKTENDIKELINVYKNDIESLLQKAEANFKSNQIKEANIDISSELCEENQPIEADENIHNWDFTGDDFIDPIFGIPPEQKNPEYVQQRSSYLSNNLQNRAEETSLPITSLRENLIKTINSNKAIVISGAPGCGKSTRVPSYIIDDWIKQNKGGSCDILISEPRRVAAISLAHRVAFEREEEIGDVCGYQVRLSTKFSKPPGGAILFATAGSLLRRFSFTPDLPGCTHLIIDEAHERSAESDAVISLAKRAMSMNPDLKMIIMSATIDTGLFSRYLGNCPVFSIPGRTFPVKSHFLDDLPSEISRRLYGAWRLNKYEDSRPTVNSMDVANLIRWVHKERPAGAILVFLPGWKEIKAVKELLENGYGSREYKVFPIHSRLAMDVQQQIFSRLPSGMRKIVLATNIAETSITVDDVLYVIDTGIHKENRTISADGLSSLGSNWISKSSVQQRKGRAGRVRPGECFHMYTKDKMESFEMNAVPEILRVPLEKTILESKIYNDKESAAEFLKQFPQPPASESIYAAVKNLIDLGALNKEEKLTPLGKRIVTFTSHPKLSKALVHSAIFKVTNPILDISTILSNNHELFHFSPDSKEDVRNVKRTYHQTSDHLALHWINKNYVGIKQNKGLVEAENFCNERNLRKYRLDIFQDLRQIYIDHLRQCKMLPPYNRSDLTGEKKYNMDELAKGVLLSGLNTVLNMKNVVNRVGKLSKSNQMVNEKGQKAFVATDSVNHKIEKRTNSAILLYCGAMHSEERRGIVVRDTSLLSPITAFLFSSKVMEIERDRKNVTFSLNSGRSAPKIKCPIEMADKLLEVRDILASITDYFIKHEGFVKPYSNIVDEENVCDIDESAMYRNISNYRNLLVERLSVILFNAERNNVVGEIASFDE